MDQYILGIDIGTTSVKVCIVNTSKDNTVEALHNKDTQSNVPSDTGPGGNKQDVFTIVSAINLCVSKLPKQLLQKVGKIGICGQMHGVMFWNNDEKQKAWEMVGKERNVRFDVVKERVSALYTWQDNRCDTDFLATLPPPQSHIRISTGFGSATIFWMARNKPHKLEKYNCSGTIMDFVISVLCNLEKPVTSNQNAASWGYFNCSTNEWNIDILAEAGFPIHLLPQVKEVGQIAGYLVDNWHSIPKGTPVGVSCGDIQCSILSTLESPYDAVLNISTSAQIGFIAKGYVPPTGPPLKSTDGYFPYFNKQFIAVAASLNGGNTLATFVKTLQQWTLELGFSVPQSKVWEKILVLGEDDNSISDLRIIPTCLGERHSPDRTASIENIHVGNIGLGQVFRSLCRGLVENLHSMMPKEILQRQQITRLVGNGSGLSRNKVLQKEVQHLYELPLVFTKGGDACKGAAMSQALP
ncbi:sedoheptulokinase-like [Cylas formicarius]|uniref:sedoheptulokinase-like n=1 Tax=Cylas formicarius TaxID=197179 RepID=UPI0029585306|nr:sedoheptulokinase-like [Cylas formicarius]XP_060529340.1 sedoheptulokinase-like [Cylas formicarius]XP_060529341.1 sedoheptulokinase-like [Cylas formicarius]XP_060529342.1 sedoheptulokinase-like [Cylas formicarius]XP_060529343.1 sedoheptulokinase-like [Cylas formicarius]